MTQKVASKALQERIERWESDKPNLVIWTKRDEEQLQVYKELLARRKAGN